MHFQRNSISCYTSEVPSVLEEIRLVVCLQNLPDRILNLEIKDTEKKCFSQIKKLHQTITL